MLLSEEKLSLNTCSNILWLFTLTLHKAGAQGAYLLNE